MALAAEPIHGITAALFFSITIIVLSDQQSPRLWGNKPFIPGIVWLKGREWHGYRMEICAVHNDEF